jgi:hypothetical protein
MTRLDAKESSTLKQLSRTSSCIEHISFKVPALETQAGNGPFSSQKT